MNRIKDKKIIILFAILLVFTIAYFLIVNKVSYAFENNYDMNAVYDKKLETITKCAEAYGKANLDDFNEEGLLYITVQNLIDDGYLIPDEDGNIKNHLNTLESLNNKKIRIKYENEKINAEIYS